MGDRLRVWPGRPYPLGATWDGEGVNVALYSENATAVDLCLFDSPGDDVEGVRIRLPELTAHVWHGYVPELKPGQLYAYRVFGTFAPELGLRFNPSKLLIDPYARAIQGQVDWDAPIFSYPLGHARGDLAMDGRDSAWGMPRCVVVDPRFDWGNDRRPAIPWHQSIIYEVHVKGFTARHPDVSEELRGTYAGLASPAAIKHFKSLGITAVELLPIHSFVDDKFLLDKGLTNYWGYNTLNYFSPEARYSSSGDMGEQIAEFKSMVKALHAAGIEVILDVVYNHTCEGNHLGPTLSFRGIDNTVYYRLTDDEPRYYMDYTGTGNSLDATHPQVLKLIMDSLRYWVREMHVDGFRFDLASTLAREAHDVSRFSAFFDISHQDPTLSQVKLIAEPWDVGEGGYQVGNFPVLWAEWNGKYRDVIRSFWKGDGGLIDDVAYRLTGSSDLYQSDGRRPYASINFVTAHDGFTLHDLVSFTEKHNEANGENNRDGTDDNRGWNCGHEGPTDDVAVQICRRQQTRNMLATLLFSQGVPMICGGDEIGRTQQGNNNAYCQDNALSWHDWSLDEERERLLEFTRRLVQIRHEQPVLRRRKFFQGRRIRGSEIKDITWLSPNGQEMTDEEWSTAFARSLGMRLSGRGLDEYDERGLRIDGDTLLLLMNAHYEDLEFTLPADGHHGRWELLVSSAENEAAVLGESFAPNEQFRLVGRSLALLRDRGASTYRGRRR
ncbi:MAG: glycogen debranching protein GlgX [Chloroflexi bacterium]|nr:glycogen debranching protein GlgX [Chloroflexota bacterium]